VVVKMSDEIRALLDEFEAKNHDLHREWTAAVGTPGYVKALWRDRDNALTKAFRDKLTAAGYPRNAPMLRLPGRVQNRG